MKRFSISYPELCLAAICSLLLATHAARAHTLPVSTLKLVPSATYLHLELMLNPFELTFFSELDANRDGRLEVGEWDGQGEAIALRILENLKLRVNDQPVVAEIAGLVQNYESHHIFVRAHFAVDARSARVSIESQLTTVTSGSHVTQVTFGTGERVQAARLDMQSNKVTFEPFEPVEEPSSSAPGPMARDGAPTLSAFNANEAAVVALLGLLLLAGIPPAVFSVLFTRHRAHGRELAHTAHHPATAGIH